MSEAVFRFEAMAHPSMLGDVVQDARDLGMPLPDGLAETPVDKLRAGQMLGIIAGQKTAKVDTLLEAAAQRTPDLAIAPMRILTGEAEQGKAVRIFSDAPTPLVEAWGDSVGQLLAPDQQIITHGTDIQPTWRTLPPRSRYHEADRATTFSLDRLLEQLERDGVDVSVFADSTPGAYKGFERAEVGVALNPSKGLKKNIAKAELPNVTRITWKQGEDNPTRVIFPGEINPEDFYLERNLDANLGFVWRMGYNIDRSVRGRARQRSTYQMDGPTARPRPDQQS